MLSNILMYKTAGIFGMGREGIAVRTFLQKNAPEMQLIEINEDNLSDLSRCDIVFKSPGVSLYRPEIQSLIQRGIPLSSSTDLFMRLKKPTQKMITITGTKGKSTTSSLLYHALKQLGVSVGFGGNIGVPLVDLVESDFDWVVAELSSYQCADFTGQPDITLLLDLYPEHLQWHGTHERYYADKINMVSQGKIKIANRTDKLTQNYLGLLKPVFFNDSDGIYAQDGFFMDNGQQLFPTSSLNLIGEHNISNACAVLTIVKQMGFNLSDCEQAFQTFQSLPHRLEKIGPVNGITFIDDSISTTPETAIAGLKSFSTDIPITLIVGGQDRGQDFTELIAYLNSDKNRFKLIALPDTGKQVFQLANQSGIESYFVEDMEQAVKTAKNITQTGGIVLLSPAAPSYNLYRNFEERGADFKQHILK